MCNNLMVVGIVNGVVVGVFWGVVFFVFVVFWLFNVL